MKRRRRKRPLRRQPAHRFYNPCIIVVSVVLCAMLALTRWPGMELMGFGPNWFIIWLVIWCLDRDLVQGLFAALCLGLIQDSLSAPWPSHVFGMVLVAIGVNAIYSRRFWQSDFFITPLIVMLAVVFNDAVLSILFSLKDQVSILHTWQRSPSLFWISPIMSGLWTPAFFWPLRSWWGLLKKLQN